jgi:hypothetical protein
MTPNEIMPNILNHGPWVANGGNHIGISNHVKMFSTITPLMKMNVQTLILNYLGVLISNNVPNDFKEKVYHISKTRAPNSLLVVVIMVYQTPLYCVETFIINIQPKTHNDLLINNYKAHYGGAKNVITLYYFPRVSMFELQP